MVCWHGINRTGLSFSELAPVLAATYGLRVIAPDAPGFGQSPALAPEAYREDRLAVLAGELLTTLDVHRSAFVGHSWGAEIGCHFAATYPDRTSGLVLLDGGHYDDDDLGVFGGEPDIDRRVEAMTASSVESFPDWSTFLSHVRMSQPRWNAALEAAWRSTARSDSGRIIVRCTPDVAIAVERGAAISPRSATYPVLQTHRTPVLLLLATEPPELAHHQLRFAARLSAAIPQAIVRPIPDAGHDLLAYRGPQLADDVGPFLSRTANSLL